MTIMIAKRKGNRVRYRNIVTGRWDRHWTKRPDSDRAPVVESPADVVRASVPSTESPNEMSRDELRALARKRGLRGYSRMNKAQLSAALIEQN